MESKPIESENKGEGDEAQLSPSQAQPKRSPLVFLKKKRVKSGSGKKRRDSGHSDGDCEAVQGTIDEERNEVVSGSNSPSVDSPALASRRLSLDSAGQPQSVPNKEKPRRGIAKVFHDLKHRSRVRKSHSAPPTAMDNNQVSSPVSVLADDDSFSSYATPMEAHSSGYSTPLFESNMASPETSLSESFIEEDEEQADDTTTVVESNNSPAQVSFNPFSASPLPANISRLVCGVYIVGPTLRRVDLADPSALPNLLATQVASVQPGILSPALASASSETLTVFQDPKAGDPETEPIVVETVESSKPDKQQTDIQEQIEEAITPIAITSSSSLATSTPTEASTSGQRSRIPLLSQHRTSVPSTSQEIASEKSQPTTDPSTRSSSTNEIRFCFSEYINGDSGSSPSRGFIRSLPPSDPKMDNTALNNTVFMTDSISPPKKKLDKLYRKTLFCCLVELCCRGLSFGLKIAVFFHGTRGNWALGQEGDPHLSCLCVWKLLTIGPFSLLKRTTCVCCNKDARCL